MPEPSAAPASSEKGSGEGALIAGEDFYYDGPYLVFTAAYHRKRGFCCGNQCRHCPYGESGEPAPDENR